MSNRSAIDFVLAHVAALEAEAQDALGGAEDAPARVVSLQSSYARLNGLSLDQDELFRESLRAVESGLFRAAHVLAWSGFIDFLHRFLVPRFAQQINAARPTWNVSAAEDLREQADYHVIEAGRAANVYGKTLMKALHGLLNRRNECAHPSGYFPDLNQSLGYMSELFSRISTIQTL